MTLTIWSNGGKHEAIVSDNDAIIFRTGLVHSNRAAAKRAAMKFVEAI